MFTGRRVRALENLIALQRAEISDLRAALASEREAFSKERSELIDRVIALAQPAVHRELHPRAPSTPRAQPASKRIHFPGYTPSFRPPVTEKIGPIDYRADVEGPTEEPTS